LECVDFGEREALVALTSPRSLREAGAYLRMKRPRRSGAKVLVGRRCVVRFCALGQFSIPRQTSMSVDNSNECPASYGSGFDPNMQPVRFGEKLNPVPLQTV
jgi:hypothetical protein